LEDRLRRAHLYIKELQKELPRHQQIDADALFAVPAESEHGENGDELEDDKPRKSSTEEKTVELDSMMDRKGHITSGNWLVSPGYHPITSHTSPSLLPGYPCRQKQT